MKRKSGEIYGTIDAGPVDIGLGRLYSIDGIVSDKDLQLIHVEF